MKLAVALLALICAAQAQSANAQEKFTFHENLHAGQTFQGEITQDMHVTATNLITGQAPQTSDSRTSQKWKLTYTVLEVKDGSATKGRILVDPNSTDVTREGGEDESKPSAPAFAGKEVTLTRHEDGPPSNDFDGDASPDDVVLLNSLLNPDSDYYPDHPVAVGDGWPARKEVAKHNGLGPDDTMEAKCTLDWVKEIDGKKVAQISVSHHVIQHEDANVREEIKADGTMLVDVESGTIFQASVKGTSTYSTPGTEAVQVTGGTEFAYTAKVQPAGKK